MLEQALIHSLFHKHLRSEKTDNVTFLNYQIARYKKTMLSYKKLSHQLESFKTHQSLISEKQVIELIYEKSFLLQKLIYCKDT